MKLPKDFVNGIWARNPIVVILLGLCSVLAVTTAAINSIVMSVAVVFVLVSSAIIVSLLKNYIPSEVRIPCFIVVIASFVTIADLVLAAWVPDVHKILGIYIPLIVVNCMILGRAEAFSSKMPVGRSILDALGMGVGYTWVLLVLGSVRELLGNGTVFGVNLMGSSYQPMLIMKLPAGAFIVLGLLMAMLHKAKHGGKKCR